MKLNFREYWGSSEPAVRQQELGRKLVHGLMALGYDSAQARSLVEQFQNQAFVDGAQDEAFRNAGAHA